MVVRPHPIRKSGTKVPPKEWTNRTSCSPCVGAKRSSVQPDGCRAAAGRPGGASAPQPPVPLAPAPGLPARNIGRHFRELAPRRSSWRALCLALVAVLLSTSAALADLRSPWYSTTEDAYIYTSETTFTSGDSIRTRVTNMDWSTSAASNMRHMATHGARFTLNFADLNNNLSATTRHTTDMPNPYYDRDLSGSKCIEGEITSESSSFPSASELYFGNYWFTRWYWIGGGTGWAWNNDDGCIDYSEQLSMQYWYTADKWDAATPTYGSGALADILPDRYYPAKARPSSNPASWADPCQYDGEAIDGAAAVASANAPQPAPAELATGYDVFTGDEVGEVRVKADLSKGVDHFAAQARELARALAGRGSARGMLTFARPVDAQVLAELKSFGIVINNAEAVSEPMANGHRLTFGDAYTPEFWDVLSQVASEEGAEMLGVIAADVTVPTVGAYLRASRHDAVFVIDLAAEQVRRTDSEVGDVVTNDVYWYLAGWDTP